METLWAYKNASIKMLILKETLYKEDNHMASKHEKILNLIDHRGNANLDHN